MQINANEQEATSLVTDFHRKMGSDHPIFFVLSEKGFDLPFDLGLSLLIRAILLPDDALLQQTVEILANADFDLLFHLATFRPYFVIRAHQDVDLVRSWDLEYPHLHHRRCFAKNFGNFHWSNHTIHFKKVKTCDEQ